MKNIFVDIESEMKSLSSHLLNLYSMSVDIYAGYFKTSATTDVGNILITSDTAVTVASKLTKGTYLSAITFFEDAEDFFTNTAVTTTDYLTTVLKVSYGESARGSILSEPVEAIGDKIKTACDLSIYILAKADYLVNLYFDEQVNDMVSSLSNQKILPGTGVTKSHVVNMITLLQQYQNMMNNSSVTAADYLSTISSWLGQVQ